MTDFPVTLYTEHRLSVSLREPDGSGIYRRPTVATLRSALDALEAQIPAGVDYFLELQRPHYIEAVWSTNQ